MLLPPLNVLETWPTPNYIDPITRGPGLLIVNVVFSALALTIVALRLYTRTWITRSVGVDDVFVLIALLFAIAMCTVTSIASQSYGWNRHAWDVPPEWFPTANKLNLAFQSLYSLSSNFTKLALLWFCRRILGAGVKGPFRILNYSLIGAMVVITLLSLVFIFMTIFQCSPIRAYWDVEPTYPYHCLNGNNDVFAASVVNIFDDLLTTIVPMPLIWRLKLRTRQRIAVISIFGLGIIADIVGAVRTYYVWTMIYNSYDLTWGAWPISVTAAIEINIGLICASAPALRPLVASISPRIFPSMQTSVSYSKRQSGSRPGMWKGAGASVSRGDYKNSSLESSHEVMLEGRNREVPLDHISVVRTVKMESYYEHGPDPYATLKKPSATSLGISEPMGLDLDGSHSAVKPSATVTTTVITNPEGVYLNPNQSKKSVVIRLSDEDIRPSVSTRRSSSGTRTPPSGKGRELPWSTYTPSHPQVFV